MGFYWAGVKTLNAVLWQFLLLTFLRVCIPYASLFQRARGICLKKYPFRIGAVTGVMCVPECMQQCVYVSECMRVCKWQQLQERVAAAPLVLSGNSNAPSWKSTNTATFTHFVIPLLTTEFAVDLDDKNGKSRTLDVNMPQRPKSLEFQVKVKNFLSCHSAENFCVLSYSDWLAPLFDLDLKKQKTLREPPGGSP